MNKIQSRTCRRLAAAAMLLGSLSLASAQTASYYLNTFDSTTDLAPNGSPAGFSNGNGTYGAGIWYGSSTVTWDGTQDNTANSGGSAHVQSTWGSDQANPDSPYEVYVGSPSDQLYYIPSPLTLSTYVSVQFDFKWDNSSTMTIDEFNDMSLVPTNNLKPGTSLSGGALGVYVANAGTGATLGTTNVPDTATNGWVHLSFPINASASGLDGGMGIMLRPANYFGSYANLTNDLTAKFWVDNIYLEGTAGPPPPPKLLPLIKAVPGLNIIASTEGNSFYDRQSVLCDSNHGVSWVGQATTGNPVTYSFTITGFPTAAANQYAMEAYMFLVPNPTGNDGAPDYNESNCIIAEVQSTPGGSQLILQYKVNDPNDNNMQYGGALYTNAPGSWDGVTTPWYETGSLGALASTLLDGTYSLKFTSSSNVTLITPDGSTTNLVIPAYYAGNFAESTSFNIYLGMQANNAASLNQAVVYGSFNLTGSVNPVSDNFAGDATLNTNLWNASVATGPQGVLVVPSSAAYWAYWSLPATGYGLEVGTNLLDFGPWTSPILYSSLSLIGYNAQLIDQSELPAGGTAFFNVVQRTFTHLLVVLPGETLAPGTATGKTGTPTPVSLSGSGGLETVTVYAVDSTYHPVNGVTDSINLISDDDGPLGGVSPNPLAMVNGVVTFTGSDAYAFSDQGTFTITATDGSSGSIPAAASSSVTVGP